MCVYDATRKAYDTCCAEHAPHVIVYDVYCVVLGCKNVAADASAHCDNHKCRIKSCPYPAAITESCSGLYCRWHQCGTLGCNVPRMKESERCIPCAMKSSTSK